MRNVLVIGGGGREHAVCHALSKSKKVGKLFCVPGNAGIEQIATCKKLSVFDFDSVYDYVEEQNIDLVFVTPDDPLAKGMVDYLVSKGIRAFGPKANAAKLESSKAFSKEFMLRHGIPTAKSEIFDCPDKAIKYLQEAKYPLVIKADGLALGKGVLICGSYDEAKTAIDDVMLKKTFGEAGGTVLIEEFLVGREVTVMAFCDGKHLSVMPSSQDHKRAFDGDKGLNTGGMGAFAPSPFFTQDKKEEFMSKIALPTVEGLIKDGIEFKGVIYFGLMMTASGIKVIEYNARLGDPETEAVLPLLKTDLTDVVDACIDGTLDKLDVSWQDKTGFTVVVASGGYPSSVVKGYEITVGELEGVTLYHAGTATKDGKLVTSGGRVFELSGVADDIDSARKLVYSQIDKISFTGSRYRTDIGRV